MQNNYSYLPAISDATFPNAVVVAVAAKRTPSRNRLKIRFGLVANDLVSCPEPSVPGTSCE